MSARERETDTAQVPPINRNIRNTYVNVSECIDIHAQPHARTSTHTRTHTHTHNDSCRKSVEKKEKKEKVEKVEKVEKSDLIDSMTIW